MSSESKDKLDQTNQGIGNDTVRPGHVSAQPTKQPKILSGTILGALGITAISAAAYLYTQNDSGNIAATEVVDKPTLVANPPSANSKITTKPAVISTKNQEVAPKATQVKAQNQKADAIKSFHKAHTTPTYKPSAANVTKEGLTNKDATSEGSNALSITSEPIKPEKTKVETVAKTKERKKLDTTGLSEAEKLVATAADDLGEGVIGALKEKEVVEKKELPEFPSKASQRRTLGKKLPALRSCAAGKSGNATAKLRLRSDGTVGAVSILGSFGTAEKACMKKALKAAKFPEFKRPFYDLTYPFSS